MFGVLISDLPHGTAEIFAATAAALIHGYAAIDVGAVLRSHVARGIAPPALEEAVLSHRVAPDALVLAAVLDAIEAAATAAPHRVMLIGYPRTAAQAIDLERVLGAPAIVLFASDKSSTAVEGTTTSRFIAATPQAPREGVTAMLSTYRARGLVCAIRIPSLVAVGDGIRSVGAALSCLQPRIVLLLSSGCTGTATTALAAWAGRTLGYVTINVPDVLAASIPRPNKPGDHVVAPQVAIAAAIAAAARMAPARGRAPRLLIMGYPRVLSVGYPRVHDMIISLEEAVARIAGCIVMASGASLLPSVAPVAAYFAAQGTSVTIDESMSVEEAFTLSRSLLE